MIFISQSGITDSSRQQAWTAWYAEHLRIMCTVEGISSARRYTTSTPDWPPSLAMYSIRSPAVFEDAHYQRIRGMGEWLPLIDRRYYKRNLFEGLEFAPDVPTGHALLVTDQDGPGLPAGHGAADAGFAWLQSVGLDRSTPWRGITVVPATDANRLGALEGVAVYWPSVSA